MPDPSDATLDPSPIPPEWIIEGTPVARKKLLARSSDRNSFVLVWACSAGRFNWFYDLDETLHIVSGEVFVTDAKSVVHCLRPGDVAFFAAGSRSSWHVPREVRKVAVCRHALPSPLALSARLWKKAIANRRSRSLFKNAF